MVNCNGSFIFEHKPRISAFASIVGKKEAQGPLREDFDQYMSNPIWNTDNSFKGRLYIGDKEAMAKVLGSVSADGSNVDISKWGFGVVEPCLPKDFPAEMDGAFVKECLKQKDLDKQVCTCMLKSVKKDYTVHSLIKTAFEDRKKLEMDITLKAAQCLAK